MDENFFPSRSSGSLADLPKSVVGKVLRRELVDMEAAGEEYERFWQYAENTYIGFPLYKQRAGPRHIPIMVMTPV